MSSGEKAALAEERLAACKKYMKVDYPDDDGLIAALMDAADRYLEGAGVNRDAAPAMYDLIVHDMTLRTYDGRDDDAAAQDPVQLWRRKRWQYRRVTCGTGWRSGWPGR